MFPNHTKFRFTKVAIFCFLAAFCLSIAAAQKVGSKRKELEAKRQLLQKQIAETKKTLELTKNQENNSLTQLQLISGQIDTREKIIDNIGQQAFELSLDIVDQKKAIQTLESDLNKLKADYAKNIVSVYKRRNIYDGLLFVFDAKNFNEAYNRLKYLNQYGQFRQKQSVLILNTQKAVIAEITEMIHIKQKKTMLMNEKEKEKEALEQDKLKEAELLTKLQQKVKSLKQKIEQQELNAKKLNKAINNLIAKEIEDARKAEAARRKAIAKKNSKDPKNSNPKKVESDKETSNSYLSATDLKLSTDFVANKGKLPWPVDNGKITETFGEHAHPTLKGIYTNNNGVDITLKPNSQIKSVFNGVVKAKFPIPGMDMVVLINHGEYFTVYARMATLNVKIGQQVSTGDILGTVATSSEDGTTRLHFEIYKQRVLQNPQLWLRKNR